MTDMKSFAGVVAWLLFCAGTSKGVFFGIVKPNPREKVSMTQDSSSDRLRSRSRVAPQDIPLLKHILGTETVPEMDSNERDYDVPGFMRTMHRHFEYEEIKGQRISDGEDDSVWLIRPERSKESI